MLNSQPIAVSTVEAGTLLGLTDRTMRRKCGAGAFSAMQSFGPGGLEYRIPLASLPAAAQIRYWVPKVKAIPQTDRRDYLGALDLPEAIARKVAQMAGVGAEVILTHCAEVKVTHLGEDDGLLAVDVDPGASSGDTSDGPQG